MANEVMLDPRVRGFETALKVGGVGVIGLVSGGIVVFAATSLAIVGGVAVPAIGLVYFLPVMARWAALKKQQSLTKLAEVYSEETIKEDEAKEGERVKALGASYQIKRSQLEGAQEELREQLPSARTDEEVRFIQTQIDSLQTVIDTAEQTLRQHKEDFEELQRANKLYIALHRSALAMEGDAAQARTTEEIQRLETSRTSIKTRMRAAMAGQTVQQMDTQLRTRPKLNLSTVVGQQS